MSRILRPPVALVLLLTTLAVHAQDGAEPLRSASQYFSAGAEAFNREDYARALVEFEAAIRAGSAGPAAHYNAAVCYYRLGDYSAAEAAFRRLAADFPEMQALADYNLGLSLVRLDRIGPAREAFQRATSAGNGEVATLAYAMLARLPRVQPDSADVSRFGLIDLSVGYDDNVALVDPLGLPASQSTDSPFAEVFFYYAGPLSQRNRLDFQATAFHLNYVDANDFDQSGLNFGFTYRQPVGGWLLSVNGQLGRTYIAGDGFEQYFGASVRFRRSLSGIGATIQFDLRHDATDDIETRYDYIAGDRDQFAARFDKTLGRARFVIDYSLRRDDRHGDGVSADRETWGLTLRRDLTTRWSGDLLVEQRDTDYDRLSPARTEKRTQAGIRAVRQLGADWRLTAEYLLADNDSSDSLFGYRRNRFSTGVSRTF
jgi:tetratricopeptide (TPR) repeat protein